MMNEIYCLIEDGAIARYNVQLPIVLNGTTIPRGAEGVEAFGLYPVVGEAPEYDPATETRNGPTYAIEGQTVRRAWVVAAKTADDLEALKSAFIRRVDADVDAIFAAAIGNRGPEYDRAALAATTYRDAGYTGVVLPSVASWAAAKSWTPRVAADDILAAADRLGQASDAIRAQRLLRKEQARTAPGIAALGLIEQTWAGFVSAVRAQLGV